MNASKVIIITGASSGLGAGLARQLGAQGHRLVLAARCEKELAEVASQSGTEAITVILDVRRRADIEQLRDRTIEAFGHIDGWINNAGRGIGKSVLEITDEDFDEMMLVNTKSALYGMQAIVPHFKERGSGHLITRRSWDGSLSPPSARSRPHGCGTCGPRASPFSLSPGLESRDPLGRT